MELELKLLLQPADVRKLARHPALRALTRTRPRMPRLRSVFWDTPAHTRWKAGVGLRVRNIPTGTGERRVQTLKYGGSGAAGWHERVELEWNVAGEGLDVAPLLASPLAKTLRKSGLFERGCPVFETAFTRSARRIEFSDGTRAELAIDQGQVRAGKRAADICEVELELERGDPARLFELAQVLVHDVPLRLGHLSKAERGYRLAAGNVRPAPQKAQSVMLDEDMTTAAALRCIVLGCVSQMQANEAGTLAGRNPEYLHQLRVGLRRLRAALGLLRDLADADAMKSVDAELRWLADRLGAARDWDVFLGETLPRLSHAIGDSAGLAGLRSRSARLRSQRKRAMREALEAPRYQALLLSLGRLFAQSELPLLRSSGNEEAALRFALPVSGFAQALLEEREHRLHQRGKGVVEAPPADRHRARIAAKKLRYAAEFFTSLYPAKRVQRYVETLEALQDHLGILNDAAVTEGLVAEAATNAPPAAEAKALVRGWCAATTAYELAAFERVWRTFKKARAFWRA